jgi:hypothetical protein
MAEQRTDYPTVYQFIRSVFNRPPIPTKLELRHLSQGRDNEVQASINSWEGKDELGIPSDEVAANIIKEAVEDAKNYPRGFTQTYAILVYRGTDDVYQARRQFNVRGRGNKFDTDDIIQESEPANEKGMLAMAMRGMDRMMDKVLQMANQTATMHDKELDRKRREVDELQKGRFAAIALVENTLDRQQERAILLRRETRFEGVKDKMVDKVEQFMPLVAGKLFPSLITANGSPELKKLGKETGIQVTIGSFFESLDKKQYKQIINILTEDEVILFIELNSKRTAEAAFEFFDNAQDTRINEIMMKVLTDNQKTVMMQAVSDIKEYIAQRRKVETEVPDNGVGETNDPS